MKKLLVTLIVAIVCAASSWAYTLDKSAVFTGDGVVVKMNSDGTCQVVSADTGTLNGYYDITSNREVEPGCSNVTVVFYLQGEQYYGTLLWPLQQGLMLHLSGATMYKVQ